MQRRWMRRGGCRGGGCGGGGCGGDRCAAIDARGGRAPIDACGGRRLVDAASVDAALVDAAVAPPCANGPGRVLWRLSWPAGQGGYARVDAWAAACAYSLADPACSLSGEPHNYASFGPGIVFNSTTDYFRVRFSVAGLSFTSATLYLAAHADGSGLPRLQVQSQLHGEYLFQPTVPISTHRLYAIDDPVLRRPTPPASPPSRCARCRPASPCPTSSCACNDGDASGVSRLGGSIPLCRRRRRAPQVQVAFTPRSERAMMRADRPVP
jgi:hypothetical protein